MLENSVKESLSELLAERQFISIRDMLGDMNEVDIAELLEEFADEDSVRIFRLLPKSQAAEVFAYLSSPMQAHIVTAITDRELSGIVAEMFMDDTADLLEEMPASVVKKILKNTDEQTRHQLNMLLQYPDSSAGSIMTTELIDLKKEMTVSQSFNRIRQQGENVEDLYTCYVTDVNRILEGIVSVRDLLLSPSDAKIADIMDTSVIYCKTTDDREEVSSMFSKYDLLAIPVVDNETRLVGVITVDDAVEVMEEEVTEDFEMLAGVTPSDDSYMNTGVISQFKNRIPWLLLLMLSAAFTGAIIDSFEGMLTKVSFLLSSIPMLMGTGGNSGSQSSILVIRSLGFDDIRGRDILKVWWKEIRVALLCGVVLAVVNFVRIFITNYYFDAKLSGDLFTCALVGFTVSASLLMTVMAAKSIGCLLPIVAKRIGLDPAVMASPLLTTIVDTLSLFIYFVVASAVFQI